LAAGGLDKTRILSFRSSTIATITMPDEREDPADDRPEQHRELPRYRHQGIHYGMSKYGWNEGARQPAHT
jgi:hypothetical protein